MSRVAVTVLLLAVVSACTPAPAAAPTASAPTMDVSATIQAAVQATMQAAPTTVPPTAIPAPSPTQPPSPEDAIDVIYNHSLRGQTLQSGASLDSYGTLGNYVEKMVGPNGPIPSRWDATRIGINWRVTLTLGEPAQGTRTMTWRVFPDRSACTLNGEARSLTPDLPNC